MIKILRRTVFILIQIFFVTEANAESLKKPVLPAVLKADNVEGDKNSNSLNATGNVEVARENSIIYADQIFYYKNEALFKAVDNVKIKNIEIGNVKSTKAEIKEDFSSGIFLDSTLILNDGSYLISPKIERHNPEVTSLKSSIYSICPNPEISQNNDLAGKKKDMISIKSDNFVIDRKEEIFKVNGGVIRFYDIPFFYTPYLSVPMPSKERKSGFLHPSYSKNSRLGIGVTIPYYFNISSNKELTVSPTFYLSTGQILLENEFHHLTSYGEYKTNFELANNQVNQSVNVSNSTQNNDPYRWNLKAKGVFDFTKNTGVDFDINTTSDNSYLRDYHFDFRGYSFSKINLDYINRRDYYSIQTLRFQEYENLTVEKTDPLMLPIIDTKTQLKSFFNKDKIFISTNTTSINRQDGLQYRRFSAIPEVELPFNYNGNLFNLSGKVQGDFYSLENDDKYSATKYDSTKTNYKPEISLNWRLPLVKKTEKKTIIIEPMATIVSSSYKTNFAKLPNEDSNNNELTISNLFTSDRISGFDRNEAGTRMSYGVKSSIFNSQGEYSLVIGQSIRKSGENQDVTIRGFNSNNKSNIVGMLYYKALKHFNISYSFHLDESSYRNEINEIIASLDLERFSFTSNYLFLRRNSQNSEAREQLNSSMNYKFNEKLSTQFTISRNMITGRNLNRSLGISYGGCCTIFGFSVTESNPANLVAAQRSFNISLSFKNL
jgi:LPS-assembly protein